MKHPRLIFIFGIAGTAFAIAVLHNLAYAFFWYWKYWWFDILLHGLGGFFLGSLVLWIIIFEYPEYFKKLLPLFATVGVTFLVGVLWEVFEYVIAVSQSSSYILDTMSDIGMNTMGILITYLLFSRYART